MTAAIPDFLRPLAGRAAHGEPLVTGRHPRDRGVDAPPVRRSAVLLLVAGPTLGSAELLLEERGHALRSQPGQFSLPGGGVEAGDAGIAATALREAWEETGLDPAAVQVLGAFAPIPMPWRSQQVTPVLGWAPERPALSAHDPIEVERLVWAALRGPGSLTDRGRRFRGRLRGQAVGPVFDLPGEAFVWGFTAMLLEQLLEGVGLPVLAADAPLRDIPAERRR